MKCTLGVFRKSVQHFGGSCAPATCFLYVTETQYKSGKTTCFTIHIFSWNDFGTSTYNIARVAQVDIYACMSTPYLKMASHPTVQHHKHTLLHICLSCFPLKWCVETSLTLHSIPVHIKCDPLSVSLYIYLLFFCQPCSKGEGYGYGSIKWPTLAGTLIYIELFPKTGLMQPATWRTSCLPVQPHAVAAWPAMQNARGKHNDDNESDNTIATKCLPRRASKTNPGAAANPQNLSGQQSRSVNPKPKAIQREPSGSRPLTLLTLTSGHPHCTGPNRPSTYLRPGLPPRPHQWPLHQLPQCC